MSDEDKSVTKKLLEDFKNIKNRKKMDSNPAVIKIENEKSKESDEAEGDLRLHDAVCDPDNIEEIETLLEENPQLCYERDRGQRTPLHTVVIDADEEAPSIIKLLLGVVESNDGETVISVERSDILNLQDAESYTPLHYAALSRQHAVVEVLLRWGADPFIQDKNGNTPLHLAAEGKLESAIDCGRELLKADPKKALINVFNNDEKTPLHKAIDARSVIMAKFLLKEGSGLNLSKKDKEGRNPLHYACSGTEEPEELCSIVKAIVERSSPSHLNQLDNRQRTPLHLAAAQRLPQIVRILVEEEKTDVLKTDDAARTALHYACQNGCYPKGHECVDILIGRKFPEKVDVVKYLFQMEDAHGHTPFMYACLNCPPPTVAKYLSVVPRPEYWLTPTYTTLLYKHSPLALKALMDKAFTEDKKRTTDSDEDILVDYGSITGYTDPVDVQPQQETKYLKQALYWEYETQREILLHPLVQLFVARKWQKLIWIIGMWVFWQLIWLGAFTTLVVSFYSGKEHSKSTAIIASFIMLVYILTSMVNEAFEAYTVKLAYLSSLTNLTQLAQNFLALIAIAPVFGGMDEPTPWGKYATATGVLLAYILSMRDIGKLHKNIGLVVEVLKQVLLQIVQVLLCCAPLWIGFTLAFVVIFDDEESLNSTFPGPIVKVLVMMTGEFEYNDTFKEDGEGGEKDQMMAYRSIRLIFFLAFLISVPVAFFNLLTGFALDKVMELRERAKVGRIAKQLEHIHFIESILLSLRPLRKVLPHDFVVSGLRKLNVTTAWIDQGYKFHTNIRERIRQAERRLVKRRGVDCIPGFRSAICCQGKLPDEVEEDIFALASSSSNRPNKETQSCFVCHK